MKLIIILSLLFLFSCNSIVYDEAVAPSTLNQKTLLMKYQGEVFKGLLPTTDLTSLSFFSAGDGSLDVSGVAECFYNKSVGADSIGWQYINLKDLPDESYCEFNLHSNQEDFDAPAIGKIVYRKFNNLNTRKLKVKMNGRTRSGIHAAQVMLDDTNIEIEINPTASSGWLDIAGCDSEFAVEFNGKKTLTIGKLLSTMSEHQECGVTITATNFSSIKESATIYLSVIEESGSKLSAPKAYTKSKDQCFKFSDKYVALTYISGFSVTKKKFCVKKQSTYEVIGGTSKNRIFYGIYKNGKWEKQL